MRGRRRAHRDYSVSIKDTPQKAGPQSNWELLGFMKALYQDPKVPQNTKQILHQLAAQVLDARGFPKPEEVKGLYQFCTVFHIKEVKNQIIHLTLNFTRDGELLRTAILQALPLWGRPATARTAALRAAATALREQGEWGQASGSAEP